MILTVTLNAAVDKTYRVESLRPGSVMRVRAMTATAGGKGLNVARVASILGEEVCAAGFLGGHSGQYVEELLAGTAIERQFVYVAGETRTCVNVMDDSGLSTEFLEPGFQVGEHDLNRFLDTYEQLLARSSVITVSGSMPEGCPVDFYAELVRLARERSVWVCLDSSGEALKRGIEALPTLIKPNRDELKAAVGEVTEDDLPAALFSLHKRGIAYVVHSMGARGAMMACAEGIFQGTTPDIPIVNPVGCGDAMIAAFAVGIRRGMDAAELFRFAIEVSTASALNPQTGGLDLGDLKAVQGRCEVRLLR